MIRFLRAERPRRPGVPRHALRVLAALRPEPDPEPLDPCGNGPIPIPRPGLDEGTRVRAITAALILIAAGDPV